MSQNIKGPPGGGNCNAEAFISKYEDPASDWGGHSGGGSHSYFTIPYRGFVSGFIRMNNISSVVDIGCGDWQFSKFMDFGGASYTGLDVVPALIDSNSARFGGPQCQFALMPTDLSDTPSGDLLLMKDVLQHLPDREIRRFVTDVFPRFRYCLITNSYQKLDTGQNHEIRVGNFRCLDLTAAPYRLRGAYVLEFSSALWERIRTLLLVNPDLALVR